MVTVSSDLDGTLASGMITNADGFFSVVFVDADHRYDGVVRDLSAWAPKVRPGGLM